jgi:cellulose synthase/poly-beta-1,6-N-acetylglucosamine synthase-like glycosyltransferase
MRLPRLAAALTAGVLLAFSVRRAILLATAVLPRRSATRPPRAARGVFAPPRSRTPARRLAARPILILVPCRNEAASMPGLLRAIDALEYPRDRLQAVIIDDASSDNSAQLAGDWAETRPWAHVLPLPANQGKARALNAALEKWAPELAPETGVAIYDADHRPAPEALRLLAAALDDVNVGAASGQMRIANGAESPAAFYAHVESLVNQGITMRAKDRLGLAPALLGANCIYRLRALQSVGGFRPGALLEDSDLTLELTRAGWRTRFVPGAMSDHHAPASLRGYIRQHLRWNRGFQQVAGARLASLWRDPALSGPLKLELTFFALGYADRLALLSAALFSLADRLRPGTFRFAPFTWLVYFGVPALEMLAGLRWARQAPSMYLRLAYVPFFYAIDLGVAAWAAMQGLARRPATWAPTERQRVASSAADAAGREAARPGADGPDTHP